MELLLISLEEMHTRLLRVEEIRFRKRTFFVGGCCRLHLLVDSLSNIFGLLWNLGKLDRMEVDRL